MQALNLGCGPDVREGWTNMDAFYEHPKVLKHDLLKTPWPFPANSFDLVLASHVMEHIPPVFAEENGVSRDVIFRVIEEIGRVLKPGGRLEVYVPLAGSVTDFENLGHYRHYNLRTMRSFEANDFEPYHTAPLRLESAKVQRGEKPYRSPWRLGFNDRLRIRGVPFVEHLRIRAPPVFSAFNAVFCRKSEIHAVFVKKGAAPA